MWGDNDVLGVHTPGTVPVLTVGASATSTTKIAVTNEASLAGADAIEFHVEGRALSASSAVSFELEYLDANGALVAAVTVPMHSGASGLFSSTVRETSIPAAATSYRTRMVASSGPLVLNQMSDTGEICEGGICGDCEECPIECVDEEGNQYSGLGIQCGDDDTCHGECVGVFLEDLAAAQSVILWP